MFLTLIVNSTPVKSWPVDLPKSDPTLSHEQNFNLREDHIAEMLRNAKFDCAGLIANNSYEFILEVKARVQPKDVVPMYEPARVITIQKLPVVYGKQKLISR